MEQTTLFYSVSPKPPRYINIKKVTIITIKLFPVGKCPEKNFDIIDTEIKTNIDRRI